MNSLLTIGAERGQFIITSVGGQIGPRPRFADVVFAVRVAPDAPAAEPSAVTLSFTVQSGSAGAATLQRRLRELADALAQPPQPEGSGPATCTLALGDLVQAPPPASAA
jgi:hypothetical protein